MADVALPKALTDFIFDLYDSVTQSQFTEEQQKLYESDFRELSSKYFGNQPWPSPQSIASECNGDPLFLAVYRELTHRQFHQVSRPTLRDRMDGWQVYRELFDEILAAAEDGIGFYMIAQWCFDIFHEFGYQFQGFCQVRSAVYASARKHGFLNEDGTISAAATTNQQSSNLLDNLNMLENNPDAWDVEIVFQYLHRFSEIGLPGSHLGSLPPVYTYFNIFGAITRSRLECLLGDFVSSLQALTPLSVHADFVIPKDENLTVTDTVNSVFSAKLSLAYHTGVSLLMLRRYKDAIKVLGDICATMMRGFKTGQLRKLPGSDQFNKQFERMSSILALLQFVCPTEGILEDMVARSIREKHGARLEAASSFEEWFQSPKFVSADPQVSTLHRHMVQMFLREMEPTVSNRSLRSYLKLYTSLPVKKLAKFHDCESPEDSLPLLLSYKVRSRQLQRDDDTAAYADGSWKDSLDIHYYIIQETVLVDEAEKQRRFENFFFKRIEQNNDILRTVLSVDTKI